MIIKRYIVRDMNEAMTRIRYELGKEAVIISQRKIKKAGLKGLFSKKVIEVTAAVENVKKKDEEELISSLEAIKKVVGKDRIPEVEKEVIVKKEPPAKAESKEILKEMQEMKSLINSFVTKNPETIERKSKLDIFLEKNDINARVGKKLATKIKNINVEGQEADKIRLATAKCITISKTKMEGRVVLVGPTGVGKTTTIAKLAGKLSLIEKRKVGLITIDTYRIGAVEQLKTYADIMNIPFRVVMTLNDMEKSIVEMKDCDVVLIDTTGRSSRNTEQILELKSFIEKANTNNIHLVVSCTTKNADIDTIIEGYKALNYNNIIITKLDETSTYGSLLNILDAGKKPLSFVTTGQNVPDDILNLTSDKISRIITGEDKIC